MSSCARLAAIRDAIGATGWLAASALVGCHLVAGIDENYREVECAELGHSCAPAAPPGWEGPLAVFVGAKEPPECPESFSEPVFGLLGRDPKPVDASDPCGCEPPADACTVQLRISAHDSCIQGVRVEAELQHGVCVAVDLMDDYLYAFSKQSEGLDCVASREGNLPPADWQEVARVCDAVPQIGRCEADAICTEPIPAAASRCIAQVGDAPCPAGAYSQKQVFFTNQRDNRQCDCGAVVGSCSGQVGYFQPYGGATALELCLNDPPLPNLVASLDTCVGPVNAEYARLQLGRDATSCEITGADAVVGSIEADGPVTLCCTTDPN